MTTSDKDSDTQNPNGTMLLSAVDLHSVTQSPAPPVDEPPPTVHAKPRPIVVTPPVRPPLGQTLAAAGQHGDELITLPGGQVRGQNEPPEPIRAPVPPYIPGRTDDDSSHVRRPDLNPSGRRLPRTPRIVGTAGLVMAVIAAIVMITLYLTDSQPTLATTKPAATAPAALTGDVGARALDLANRQGEAFNGFIAQIGPELKSLDDRIADVEKDKAELAALRKKVAELEQIVATLQQSAGNELPSEGDGDVEQPAVVGIDDLVPDQAPEDTLINPETVYKPQK